MSQKPIHELPIDPNSPERLAAAERVVLLSRVAVAKAWHEDNLHNDPEATAHDKRVSRDKKRQAVQELSAFDEQHPELVPPEE